jgi:hypothetical protein
MDRIDELPDEIQTSPLSFVQLLRPDRFGDCGRIESRPLIRHVDPDCFGSQLSPDIDPLAAVFAVATDDRVAERFGEDYAKTKSNCLGGVLARQAVPSHQLYRFFDAGDIAGEPQCHQRCSASIRGQRTADTEAERRSHAAALKAGERLLGGLVDGEQRIELGQLEQRAQILVESGQSELATGLTNAL